MKDWSASTDVVNFMRISYWRWYDCACASFTSLAIALHCSDKTNTPLMLLWTKVKWSIPSHIIVDAIAYICWSNSYIRICIETNRKKVKEAKGSNASIRINIYIFNKIFLSIYVGNSFTLKVRFLFNMFFFLNNKIHQN